MTKFTKEIREQMAKDVIGKKVKEFYYEEEGDYYVMAFDSDNNLETCFRFMVDAQAEIEKKDDRIDELEEANGDWCSIHIDDKKKIKSLEEGINKALESENSEEIHRILGELI